MPLPYRYWEKLEKNAVLLAVLIAIAVSFGGLAEIIPLFNDAQTVKPAPGITPYEPLRLAGRDVYVREGCYLCHSQMIRTLSFETQRYGRFSQAGEFVYDRPFQWGSKRTGPDLHRVGGRYSDDWHRLHLMNPRDLVPESNMPAYPWLARTAANAEDIEAKLKALRRLGVPYATEEISKSRDDLKGKSEMDALIAYLQMTGTLVDFRTYKAEAPENRR